MRYLYTPFLAQAYGEGPYGECSYENNIPNCVTTPAPSPSPPSASTGTAASNAATGSGGSLVNTGTAAALVIALAFAIILAAVLVRFWRRRKHPKDINN